MTKKDIIQNVADELGCTHSLAKSVVQQTLDGVINVLATEDRVELRNFGVFEVRYREPRQAINPRTGEKVQTEGRFVVSFKPGKAMVQKVNEKRGAEKKADAKPAKKAKAEKPAKAEKAAKAEKPAKAKKSTKSTKKSDK